MTLPYPEFKGQKMSKIQNNIEVNKTKCQDRYYTNKHKKGSHQGISLLQQDH